MNRHKIDHRPGRMQALIAGKRGYRPSKAHASHRPACGPVRTAPALPPKLGPWLDIKLAETWSPEQISGYFKAMGSPPLATKPSTNALHRQARRWHPAIALCAARRARRKRYGGTRATRHDPETSLRSSKRPSIVDSRKTFRRLGRRLGHWCRPSSRHSSRSTSASLAIP